MTLCLHNSVAICIRLPKMHSRFGHANSLTASKVLLYHNLEIATFLTEATPQELFRHILFSGHLYLIQVIQIYNFNTRYRGVFNSCEKAYELYRSKGCYGFYGLFMKMKEFLQLVYKVFWELNPRIIMIRRLRLRWIAHQHVTTVSIDFGL